MIKVILPQLNPSYICHMKKLIVFIVVLFFAKPIFPILDFVINYDAIQELCINKGKPEMQCNGSCHLKNELAKTAQDDNPFTHKKTTTFISEILFFNPFQWELQIPLITVCQKVVKGMHQNKYAYLPVFDLSKPPLS